MASSYICVLSIQKQYLNRYLSSPLKHHNLHFSLSQHSILFFSFVYAACSDVSNLILW